MDRIVVTGKILDAALSVLRSQGHEVDAWMEAAPQPRSRLLEQVVGAQALVVLLSERVDVELLDAAGDRLRVVANVAAGPITSTWKRAALEASRSRIRWAC